MISSTGRKNLTRHYRWLAAGLLATSCVLTLFAHEGHQPLPTKGVQVDLKKGQVTLSPAARAALDVQTSDVRRREVPAVLRAYATVVAPWTHRAYATSRLQGQITKLHVRPGDSVEAGQSLVELDSLDLHTLRLDYQKAQQDLELSGKLLESMAPAAKAGSVPGQRLIEIENAHRQNLNALEVLRAKAAGLQVTERELGSSATGDATPLRLRVASPIGGIVVHTDVATGRFVEPTEHLFEIVDSASVWVKIGVLERDLHRIATGQSVRLTFPGLPGESFDATVEKLGAWLDPATHEGIAWVRLDNRDAGPRLLPGMTGQAELLLPGRSLPLAVPTVAVFSDGAERFVFVEAAVTKGASVFRKESVVLGRRTRELAEVTSGAIYTGDRVMTQGGHELSSLFFSGTLRLSSQTAHSIGLRTAEVSEHVVEQILSLDGALDVPPQSRTFASSRLAGTLRGILVDRAQRVSAGEILAEVASLELQDIQLELLKAHLDGELWRETLRRLRAAGDAVPRRTLLEAENRVLSLQTLLQSVRQKLLSVGLTASQIDEVLNSRRVIDVLPIRAPLDGIVVQFDHILGESVRADQTLFEIHDVSRTWVQAFVGERDARLVRVGQKARMRLVAQPELTIEGAVTRVGPIVGSESRMRVAWIDFEAPPSVALLHAMLARVSLIVDRPSPTLAVPHEAVVRDGLRNYVFVQTADRTFERRAIEPGRTDDLFVEVQRGLQRGEVIATLGVGQLQAAFSATR